MISPWKREAGVVVIESIGGRATYPKRNTALRTSAEREWQYAFSVRFFFVFAHGKLCQSGINVRRKLQHGGRKRKYYMLSRESGNFKFFFCAVYEPSTVKINCIIPTEIIRVTLIIKFCDSYCANEQQIEKLLVVLFVFRFTFICLLCLIWNICGSVYFSFFTIVSKYCNSIVFLI